MRCVVVGAGLLGLTTAWFLRQRGAEVSVFERRSGVGLETSFANGGMLHASQASPWNEPGAMWQALKSLGREESALLIRPLALARMLPWTWAFFRNSSAPRYLENVAKNARLAQYSLAVFNTEFASREFAFEHAKLGTLKIYRTQEALDAAANIAVRCRDWDVRYALLDSGAIIALEPALSPIRAALSGGIHFPDDVSGDAYSFCRALAKACAERGVVFQFDAAVERLVGDSSGVHGVVVDGHVHNSDACVIAAGSYSGQLCAPLGVRVPVQPVKGYSLSVPMDSWPLAPRLPVIDEHFHAAVCPLGSQLRVAGTAEFAGFDTRLTRSRIDNLYRLIDSIYPDAAHFLDRDATLEWTGFRPMSPDGVGVMGSTPLRGLFLNTGHGHLGWTMAPGAGKLVADDILDGSGDMALDDYAIARFSN
jgi:D-amino-acid dehydrogenase